MGISDMFRDHDPAPWVRPAAAAEEEFWRNEQSDDASPEALRMNEDANVAAREVGWSPDVGRHGRRFYDESDGDASALNLRKSKFGAKLSDEEAEWWAEQEAGAAEDRRAIEAEKGHTPTSDEDEATLEAELAKLDGQADGRKQRFNFTPKPQSKSAFRQELADAEKPEPTEGSQVEEFIAAERLANERLEARAAKLEADIQRITPPPADTSPQAQRTIAIRSAMHADAQQTVAKHPDFHAAFDHLHRQVDHDLVAKGVKDASQREELRLQLFGEVVAAEARAGRSPAAKFYELARQTGWGA